MDGAGNNKMEDELNIKFKSDLKNEIQKELSNDAIKDRKSEIILGPKLIPLKIANKVNKAVCKIRIETTGGIAHGTRFFFKLFRFKKIFNNMLPCNKFYFRE